MYGEGFYTKDKSGFPWACHGLSMLWLGLWEAPYLVGFVHQSFSHNECVQSQPLSQPFYIDYSTNIATPVQHALNGQSVRRSPLNKYTKESAFANIEGFSQPLVGKPVVSERFQQQSVVSLLAAAMGPPEPYSSGRNRSKRTAQQNQIGAEPHDASNS
ncbi:hypothetical protein Tco_0312519 [Tanacetum coccineum]